MLNLIDNFTKTIKELKQKYFRYIVIYFVISFGITYFLESGTRGFAFLLAIPLVALGLYLANQRTEALLKQSKTDSNRLLAETFAKSIELLGHKEAAVRQGAIYALGKVAKENTGELVVITDTLCAFIRHNQANSNSIATEINKNLKIDIEAAIKTIVKLSSDFKAGDENSTKYDLSNIYLSYADFSNAKLVNFNLSDAYFNECIFEKVNFSNSNLVGTQFIKADFTEVEFNKETELSRKGQHIETNLSSVKNLTREQLNKATGVNNCKLTIKLPIELKAPKEWRY